MGIATLNRLVADFKSDATGDKQLRLKDFHGQNVVLYFYPKDSTPGCTLEGQDFRDLHSKFKRQKTVILGVSRDSIAAHEKFREKQKLPFDLLSDADEKLCAEFDVIREKTYVWTKIHGHRTQHVSHRRQRHTMARMAQSEGQGACRRGSRRRPGTERLSHSWELIHETASVRTR